MARKSKSYNKLPFWSYEDNPFGESGFARVSADLLKSEKFQDLSPACKYFYIVLMAYKYTSMQQECLYEYKKKIHEEMGEPEILYKYDLNREVHDPEAPEFVFPRKHYEQFGFSKAYVHKYMTELREHGFIKKKTITEKQFFDKKVNLYEFSNEWKQMKRGEKIDIPKSKGNQTKA